MSSFRAKTALAWFLGIFLLGLFGLGLWQLAPAARDFLSDPRQRSRLQELALRAWPAGLPGQDRLATRLASNGQCGILRSQGPLQGEQIFGQPLVLRKNAASPGQKVRCATTNFGHLEIDSYTESQVELLRDANLPIGIAVLKGDLNLSWRGSFAARIFLPEVSFTYAVTKAKTNCVLLLNWQNAYLLNVFSSCDAQVTLAGQNPMATRPALRFTSANDAELRIGERKLGANEQALLSGSGLHFMEKQ